MEVGELRRKLLELLKTDEEFRLTVAGLLGLREILTAIRALQEQVAENTQAIRSLQEQVAENTRAIRSLQEQVAEHSRAIRSLQEQMAEHSQVIRSLQEEMVKHTRMIHALGARWGIYAESAFRSAMRGLVEQLFGGKVQVWRYEDKEGVVFGRPAVVEVDLVVSDREHVLVEVKSSVSRADVYELWRIGQLYQRVKGVAPRLAIVSPYVDDAAKRAAQELGIDVYTHPYQ